MSIYSGPKIIEIIKQSRVNGKQAAGTGAPYINIEPFDEKFVGPNSVDVHLANKLKVYHLDDVNEKHPEIFYHKQHPARYDLLPLNGFVHTRLENPTDELTIDSTHGLELHPGILYLGSTVERTETHGCVPWLDGRSSIGRLGIQVHFTAGRGDDGFEGQWTLEIAVVHKTLIFPGLRVGQISFFDLIGERKPYQGRYQGSQGAEASRLYLDPIPKPEDKK